MIAGCVNTFSPIPIGDEKMIHRKTILASDSTNRSMEKYVPRDAA